MSVDLCRQTFRFENGKALKKHFTCTTLDITFDYFLPLFTSPQTYRPPLVGHILLGPLAEVPEAGLDLLEAGGHVLHVRLQLRQRGDALDLA